MKTVVTLISSLLMGAFSTNTLGPMQEIHYYLANKRRFFYALGFYAAGFVFVMTGIICGSIEATLQYESQGFIFMSAMLTLAGAFAGAGLFLGLVGKLVTPRFVPEPPKFAGIGAGADIGQLIEGAMQIFSEFKREPEMPRYSQQPPAPQPPPTPAARPSAPLAEERTFDMLH